MKKIIFFSLFLIMAVTSFSQQTNPAPTLTKQDYLQKSKSQKTIAWCLLGGGGLVFLVGVNRYFNQRDTIDDNGTIMLIGGLTTAASIPFFISASKNKKKAASLSLKNEMVPQFFKGGIVSRPTPSLTLKISL